MEKTSDREPMTQQDRVFRALCEEIMAGVYAPGDKMTMEELSNRFEVSIMPIRDALRRLAETEIVSLRPKRAVRIATLPIEAFEEICEMRLALESLATARATELSRDRDLDALEALAAAADRTLEEDRWRDYQAANTAFHMKLYEISARPALCRTIYRLWLRLGPYVRFWGAEGANEARERHFHVVSAMRRREPDVAAALNAADIRAGMNHVRRRAFPAADPIQQGGRRGAS